MCTSVCLCRLCFMQVIKIEYRHFLHLPDDIITVKLSPSDPFCPVGQLVGRSVHLSWVSRPCSYRSIWSICLPKSLVAKEISFGTSVQQGLKQHSNTFYLTDLFHHVFPSVLHQPSAWYRHQFLGLKWLNNQPTIYYSK